MDITINETSPATAALAAGAAPFARSFESGFATRPRVKADTIATAIKIGDPASFDRAVRTIRETRGVVTSVSDEVRRALLGTQAALATPTASPIVGSGSVVSVTCPNVGQVAALLPPGAPGLAPPLVPPGVRIGVGFRATDARTGEVVSGGDGSRIECATVPFRELPASQVIAGSLPPGVVADDLLSGTFTLSVTVDAAAATPAAGAQGRRAQTADAPFPFSAAPAVLPRQPQRGNLGRGL
jgi:hypothetical protein